MTGICHHPMLGRWTVMRNQLSWVFQDCRLSSHHREEGLARLDISRQSRLHTLDIEDVRSTKFGSVGKLVRADLLVAPCEVVNPDPWFVARDFDQTRVLPEPDQLETLVIDSKTYVCPAVAIIPSATWNAVDPAPRVGCIAYLISLASSVSSSILFPYPETKSSFWITSRRL